MHCPFCNSKLVDETILYLDAKYRHSVLDIPLPFHYCTYYHCILEPTLYIYAPGFILAYNHPQTTQIQSGFMQCSLTLFSEAMNAEYNLDDIIKFNDLNFKIGTFLFLPLQNLYIAEEQLQDTEYLKIVDVILET